MQLDVTVPTLEDKILQRAIVMLLEPIYEGDFSESSFGFRPRRSAHQALEALWDGAMAGSGGWILEVDIRKFFDTLDQGWLRELLRHRIRDGVAQPETSGTLCLLRHHGEFPQLGFLSSTGDAHLAVLAQPP